MDASPTDPLPPAHLADLRRSLAALAAFAVVALALYQGALSGGEITDDFTYLSQNTYVRDFDGARLVEILDPDGSPAMYAANYFPVTLLAHAGAWSVFGSDWRGHHVLNVLLHALAAVLLAALLRRHGASEAASWLGGAIFLVHPANIEAVAWMSQLKTVGSMVFALAALLALPAHPLPATLLFGLGLLTKPQAAVALVFAVLWAWQSRPGRPRDAGPDRGSAPPVRAPDARWLLLWGAVFALYAVAEFRLFSVGTSATAPLHSEPHLQAANIAAIGLRYLLMATTTWGIGAFQQPDAIESWLSPWVVGALAVYALLGWRWIASLRAGAPEARWWTFALASFVPVAQLFPFLYPVADRYLYFILPGLIGGALIAVEPWLRARGPQALRIAAAAAAIGIIALGARSEPRAALWGRPALVLADSVRQYPDGVTAHLLRGRNAARQGDVGSAVTELEAARRRGFTGLSQLMSDPVYAAARRDARFQTLLRALARDWVDRIEGRSRPTQLGLKSLASSYLVLGEPARAADALDRALVLGGPLEDELRALRTQLAGAGAGDPR